MLTAAFMHPDLRRDGGVMMPKSISAFDLVATQSSRNPIDRVPRRKQGEAVGKYLTVRISIMVFLSCMVSVSLGAQEAGGTPPGTVPGQKGNGTLIGRAA